MSLFASLAIVSIANGAFLYFEEFREGQWGLAKSIDDQYFQTGQQFAFSKTGEIAFVDSRGKVFKKSSGVTKQIMSLPGVCANPGWAPSGQQLVVACFTFNNRQEDSALWLHDFETNHSTMLYDAPGLQNQPSWSPDGNFIAFVSGVRVETERVIERIWMYEMSSGAAHEVLGFSDQMLNPAWSPDGSMLAFSAAGSDGLDIWIYKLKQKSLERITEHIAYDDAPAWHPDGVSITFQSTRSGEMELWSVDVAQPRAATRVSSEIRQARSPIWNLQ